ncbi:hypothetical protein [Nocardioides sp. LS1]|uniref:hypothetical protein n=1 Tax=Nocardioides sp. LS1 TaxID=1027620 RepID=UPI000F622B74|nr:hypothetical protein [Nocardioides sp. LS1]GCD88727.1 hypothetical protein NLS1_07330 [Nocardioides sp. LS1]
MATERSTGVGLSAALVLVLAATVIPPLTGWDVHARDTGADVFPPLHGYVQAKLGPGTIPALVLALLGWRHARALADCLPWRRLLVTSYAAGLGWLLSLAYVDGAAGISRVLGNHYEYLRTARQVTSVHTLLQVYVDRIPEGSAGQWPVHVAGHPPGTLLFFVLLDRIGLGGDYAAGLVVTVLAATTALAVMVTLRLLGGEAVARRAAPFLVLGPAAVFMAVSADALMGAVVAWGLAALAAGATAASRGRMVAWSTLAGLLLGYACLMSYGLPLVGLLAVAVLVLARSWRPLPVAAVLALAVVLAFAAGGFRLWEAYPVLADRYWAGIAAVRPASYWMWGNLAALVISAGPVLGAGLANLRRTTDRLVLWLAGSAVAAVLLADASRMSKAEVERIWLPFVPWLLLTTALLPERWRRPALALQLVTALLVQHLLYTSW